MIKDYRNVKKVKDYHTDWVLKTKEGKQSSRRKQTKLIEGSVGKTKTKTQRQDHRSPCYNQDMSRGNLKNGIGQTKPDERSTTMVGGKNMLQL